MPPVQFVSFKQSTGIDGSDTFTFDAIPTGIRKGDTILGIIGADPGVVDPLDGNAGGTAYEKLLTVNTANGTVWVGRTIATGDEDADSLAIYSRGTITWGTSLLMVYRDLDLSGACVGSGVNVAASTNFACPGRTMVRYQDLYLGIVVVSSANVAVTPPAGGVERFDASDGGTRRLEIFDILLETAGATFSKTATTAGAQSGLAASLALPGAGLRGFGKTLSGIHAIPGMLGLPTKGI
jgi:hypothetical protein